MAQEPLNSHSFSHLQNQHEPSGLAPHCAIIGAGVAGSLLAAMLSDKGLSCTLYEKSRGSGGRASSKRLPEGGSCDLGAPCFELSDPVLHKLRDQWLADGVIAPLSAAQNETEFTAVPRMSALTRALIEKPASDPSQQTQFVTSTRIHHIRRRSGVWHLLDEKYQTLGKATHLIITAPASQAAMLLTSPQVPSDYLLKAHEASRDCVPQWVMAFEGNIDTSTINIGLDHEVIERLVCDSAKPARHSDSQRWVVHTQPEWTMLNIETPVAQVSEQLQQALMSVFPTLQIKACLAPHRWLLARHKPAEGAGYLWHEALNLGVAGDWLAGGDIQGAMLSALKLVDAIAMTNADALNELTGEVIND